MDLGCLLAYLGRGFIRQWQVWARTWGGRKGHCIQIVIRATRTDEAHQGERPALWRSPVVMEVARPGEPGTEKQAGGVCWKLRGGWQVGLPPRESVRT